MKTVEINGRKVGDGEPCCFMAEIGGNYKGFNDAKILIDSAKKIGIEVIKFQTFEANTVTTKNNQIDLKAIGKLNQYNLFKKLEPDKKVQKQLYDYSVQQGLMAITSPSHLKDLDFIDSLNPPAYKIGSDLACHIPLLRKIAKTGKPIILSTGMCTIIEVSRAVVTIKNEGNNNIILLHCISDYPSKVGEANLKVIPELKRIFNLPVGFSDHSIGNELSISAAALGANMIERHFRSELTQKGSDYLLSSDEKEYEQIIKSSRKVESALGDGIKQPSKTELENLKTNRVSIIVMKDIKSGTNITEDMIDIRRPATGLNPRFFEDIIGRTTKVDIKKEEPLKWEMLQ